MGEFTGIGWTDHTFNPWIGCTKVSPGCDHCYAATLANRHKWAEWGAGNDRKRTSYSYWRQPLSWDRKAKAADEQRFVFCASLADVFDNEVDELWRRDLIRLIEATPNLTWLLLTKRIGNVEKMTDPLRGNLMLPPNVALGATMVNQEEYDRDRIKLKRAAEINGVRFTFASIEPMLGLVILDSNAPDWIIVGGESGANARPIKPEWVRKLRDQSAELKRTFFFKQWGGITPKAAGKTLDGRDWCDRPFANYRAAETPLSIEQEPPS